MKARHYCTICCQKHSFSGYFTFSIMFYALHKRSGKCFIAKGIHIKPSCLICSSVCSWFGFGHFHWWEFVQYLFVTVQNPYLGINVHHYALQERLLFTNIFILLFPCILAFLPIFLLYSFDFEKCNYYEPTSPFLKECLR